MLEAALARTVGHVKACDGSAGCRLRREPGISRGLRGLDRGGGSGFRLQELVRRKAEPLPNVGVVTVEVLVRADEVDADLLGERRAQVSVLRKEMQRRLDVVAIHPVRDEVVEVAIAIEILL